MGRVVGLDYGSVRVGVAISDERHIIATPVSTLQNRPNFAEELQKLLKPYGVIEKIVIGLPLEMSGREGMMAAETRKFAESIEKSVNLPIEFWDERLTSALVEKTFASVGVNRKKRAQKSDVLAATVILQSYLDRHARQE